MACKKNYNELHDVYGEDNNNSACSLFESYSIDNTQNSVTFMHVLSFVGVVPFSILCLQRRKNDIG